MLQRSFNSRSKASVVGVALLGLLNASAIAAAVTEIGCPAGPTAAAAADSIDVAQRPAPVYFAPCPFQAGDADCSGGPADFFDVGPFWMALINTPLYQATYCGGDLCAADVDCNGSVDFFEIDPFLDCLFTPGGCPPCP